MRKIQTKAEINRQKKKNQIIVGTVMIGLLFISTLGYSFMSGDNKNKDYKTTELGINFFREDGYWKALLGEKLIISQNLPSEVSNIHVNISLVLEQYTNQPLYFVNPNRGASEILNNIGEYILRYQEACDLLEESDNLCEGDLPVKDCEDNLIIFREGSETKVYQNNNCIYIIGDGIKGADAFLYKLLV